MIVARDFRPVFCMAPDRLCRQCRQSFSADHRLINRAVASKDIVERCPSPKIKSLDPGEVWRILVPVLVKAFMRAEDDLPARKRAGPITAEFWF